MLVTVAEDRLTLRPSGLYGASRIQVTVTDPSGLSDTAAFHLSIMPDQKRLLGGHGAGQISWVFMEPDTAEGILIELPPLGYPAGLSLTSLPRQGRLSASHRGQQYLKCQQEPGFQGLDQFTYQVGQFDGTYPVER